MGRKSGMLALFQAEIDVQDGEGVEELPLVFMQALDLDVEQEAGIQAKPIVAVHVSRRAGFSFPA